MTDNNDHGLTLGQLQEGAHSLAKTRRELVDDLEKRIAAAAQAEANYEKAKATAILRLKADGVSATEAVARAKGECYDQIVDHGIAVGMVQVTKAKIEGLDGERASLHRVADSSSRVDRSGVGG